MSELESAAMQDEFGVVAGWTEQAVHVVGPRSAVPAGCRGSGSEAALRWLADALGVQPGTRVLDVGAGVGGPAGWLAGERGARAVCAEPMTAAAGACRRLFGLPAVAALGQALPLVDRSFEVAWCLGVLCTTRDKAGALTELRRMLVDGGRLGLLVFVAEGELPAPLPDGNEFPTQVELHRLLDSAGFDVVTTATADLHDSPPEWDDLVAAVDAEVQRRHGRDPRWARSQEQSGRMGRLIGGGHLRPSMVHAVARRATIS